MFSSLTNAANERLDVSFHPGQNNHSLVVLGHGVTGNKDRPMLIAIAEALSARGWPCLRISFSGNGNSEGEFEKSTISKEVADLQSILAQVPVETRVAYIGHSMGGAVGVLTAVRDEKISALISLAGMVFTADFYQREFAQLTPGESIMWDDDDCPLSQEFVDDLKLQNDLLDAAAAVEVPWLLIHGSADDVVPPVDSESAFARATVASKKLLLLEGAGHSFDETSYRVMAAEIDAWLELSMK